MFINSRLGCGTRGSEFPAAPATITITPPVLPLCFANALLTLYAVVVVVVTIVALILILTLILIAMSR